MKFYSLVLCSCVLVYLFRHNKRAKQNLFTSMFLTLSVLEFVLNTWFKHTTFSIRAGYNQSFSGFLVFFKSFESFFLIQKIYALLIKKTSFIWVICYDFAIVWLFECFLNSIWKIYQLDLLFESFHHFSPYNNGEFQLEQNV